MKLNGGEIDTLVALIERGPLWDGDLPSKTGRDSLIEKGLAAKIVYKCSDGYQAATYAGRDAYKALFPCEDGKSADSIAEARSNRYAKRIIQKVSRK